MGRPPDGAFGILLSLFWDGVGGGEGVVRGEIPMCPTHYRIYHCHCDFFLLVFFRFFACLDGENVSMARVVGELVGENAGAPGDLVGVFCKATVFVYHVSGRRGHSSTCGGGA